MSDLYILDTAGPVPVSLANMKTYLKLTATSDDALLTEMLSAATTWGEKYTHKDFRANTWQLLIDVFLDRICIRRAPVASITSVEYLVSGSFNTVDASVYYLKKSLQFSEILLNEDQSWPTNKDEREQAIQIEFVTETYRDTDAIATAIKRHVAYWYTNRGDCGGNGGSCDCDQAAKGSGVTSIYNQFRTSRV